MPDAYSSCLPWSRHMLRLPLLCHLSPSPVFILNRGPRIQISFVADVSRDAVRYVCCVSTVQITSGISVAIRIKRCAHDVQWHHSRPRHHRLHKKKTCVKKTDTMIPAPPAQAWTDLRANLRLHIYTLAKDHASLHHAVCGQNKSQKTINRPLKLLLPHPHTPSACRNFTCPFSTNKV